MPRLTSNPRADEELAEASRYYALQSRELATRFRDEIDSVVERLLEYPMIGRRAYGGVRVALVRAFPYSVVYRPTSRGIRILAVAHTSREPGYWRDRR